jgi:hypothetical protein
MVLEYNFSGFLSGKSECGKIWIYAHNVRFVCEERTLAENPLQFICSTKRILDCPSECFG